VVHKTHPNILLDLYNSCLRSGTFPTEWKIASVVLLKKRNKPDGVPSSYMPLCLFNDVGKVFEFLLARRLEDHMSDSGGLSANQFGFRKGKSTDDAVRELQAKLLEGVDGGKYCLAFSIDIKNAFNSIKWSDIMDALPGWSVPQYLQNMFRSYFFGRMGTVHANCVEGGTLEIEISGGVPQGSVVCPLLWNPEDVLGGEVEVKDSSRPLLIGIRGIGQDEKEEDVVSVVCRYGAIPEEVCVTKMGPSFGASLSRYSGKSYCRRSGSSRTDIMWSSSERYPNNKML